MLTLDFDFSEIEKKLDGFTKVVEESTHKAAQAGAQVYYDEVRRRAVSVGNSRSIQDSIYQKFVPETAGDALGSSATFHVSWRKQYAKTNVKTGPNGDAYLPYSTIGYWIEFGHIQRYASYEKNGKWYTAVQPSKKGTKAPGRKASQAAKDAYYVMRAGGPIHWMPKSFLRSSYAAKQNEAVIAVETKLNALIMEAYK